MKNFRSFISEKELTKVPCRRCGGSGEYSYNLIHGTMCYGCMGKGYQMVDLEAERKRQITNAQKQAARQQYHAEVRAVTDALAVEMNPKYGPFDISTALGLEKLSNSIYKATGKNLFQHRDERLKVLNIRKPL